MQNKWGTNGSTLKKHFLRFTELKELRLLSLKAIIMQFNNHETRERRAVSICGKAHLPANSYPTGVEGGPGVRGVPNDPEKGHTK